METINKNSFSQKKLFLSDSFLREIKDKRIYYVSFSVVSLVMFFSCVIDMVDGIDFLRHHKDIQDTQVLFLIGLVISLGAILSVITFLISINNTIKITNIIKAKKENKNITPFSEKIKIKDYIIESDQVLSLEDNDASIKVKVNFEDFSGSINTTLDQIKKANGYVKITGEQYIYKNCLYVFWKEADFSGFNPIGGLEI